MKSPSPSSRRAARETALRTLYSIEVGKPAAVSETLEESIAAQDLDQDAAAFTRALVGSVLQAKKALDDEIGKFAIGFPPERQTVVDRSILRIAVAEVVLGASDAPHGVIANEAVELAKKYSTPEAAKFINGILGSLIREHQSQKETGGDSPCA